MVSIEIRGIVVTSTSNPQFENGLR